MSHSLANLEHHHFKYAQFRRPGDVHVHFFGTATLSCAAGMRAEPSDVFEITAPEFGLPLANPLAIAADERLEVRALQGSEGQMIRIAVTGAGKIVRDQHLPAIGGNGHYSLVAVADPAGGPEGVAHYPSQDALLAAEQVDAVVVATPPQVRFALAEAALKAGKHVFLEKPPAMTVSALARLEALARDAGVTLFTGWHSQHADAVPRAADWLAGRRVRHIDIVWREDIRRWHPGQAWIWQAGGMGVFDPGINALSILTRIHPGAVWLEAAALDVPSNRAAPIAARLKGRLAGGGSLTADLDWRQEGPQSWTITIDSDDGRLVLADGGAKLGIDGEAVSVALEGEYPSLYRRFAELVEAGASDVDSRPLMLVADAFMIASVQSTDPFFD